MRETIRRALARVHCYLFGHGVPRHTHTSASGLLDWYACPRCGGATYGVERSTGWHYRSVGHYLQDRAGRDA